MVLCCSCSMVQGDAIVHFLLYLPADASKHLRYLRYSNHVKERTTLKIHGITHLCGLKQISIMNCSRNSQLPIKGKCTF